MILLPVITIILIFCFYLKSNRFRFGIVSLLILTYLAMGSIALILELAGQFKSVIPISLEPMAYLSICLFITFWGFTGFRDQKFTTIKIENMYFYRVLETFLLIGGLLTIIFFLPFAYKALTGDVNLNRVNIVFAGNELKDFGIINSIFSLMANLFILNQICSFINFIPRNKKRTLFRAYLLLISSISYVIYIFAYVGRDGVVFWLMSYLFCYLLFRDFLGKEILRKIHFLFALTLIMLLIPFLIVTVARFSNFEAGIVWQILKYGGMQLSNFNDYYIILDPLGNGWIGFPVFVNFIEWVTFSEIQPYNKDEMFSFFLNHGVEPWKFTTFIGTLMLDFGKIWTLGFLCLLSIVVRRILQRVSTKGVLKFSNLLVLTLLYQVVYWGVFYFRQYSANYYILFIILLFCIFKISNMKDFSAHFFKMDQTQRRRTGEISWLNKVFRQIVHK